METDEVNHNHDDVKQVKRVAVMPRTEQIFELQTIIRDRSTDHSAFVFYADRLMRLLIEEGLNRLPTTSITVTTPTGLPYQGVAFARGNCGVAVCRSGEAMEQALRQCCRSIRIGKVLIADDNRVLYARLSPDIDKRRVLLLYPILSTGMTAMKAISVLTDSGVKEDHILLLCLFCTPPSIEQITGKYGVSILTTDISNCVPHNFATKYFGTD